MMTDAATLRLYAEYIADREGLDRDLFLRFLEEENILSQQDAQAILDAVEEFRQREADGTLPTSSASTEAGVTLPLYPDEDINPAPVTAYQPPETEGGVPLGAMAPSGPVGEADVAGALAAIRATVPGAEEEDGPLRVVRGRRVGGGSSRGGGSGTRSTATAAPRATVPLGTTIPSGFRRPYSDLRSSTATPAEGDLYYPLWGSRDDERYAVGNIARLAGVEPNMGPLGRQVTGYVPQLRDQVDVRDALSGAITRPTSDIATELAGLLRQGKTNALDNPLDALRQVAMLRPEAEALPYGQQTLAQRAADPDGAAAMLLAVLRGHLSPSIIRYLPEVLQGRSDAYRNLGSGAGMTPLEFYLQMFQPALQAAA